MTNKFSRDMKTLTLIADSGSTKTDWYAGTDAAGGQALHSAGMNPFFLSEDEMTRLLGEVFPADFPPVGAVHFYGAGCTPQMAPKVEALLRRRFPSAQVQVESDMLGAARAVCGHEAGIACILGTGSNSCEFDGERIQRQVPTLGYVLGDLGGGDALGKTLLTHLYKGLLPQPVKDAFEERYHLTQADILNKVYKQPLPGRFLASLAPFLADHRHIPEVRALTVGELRHFLHTDVRQYDVHRLQAGFVGSVAYHFADELREAAECEGVRLGRILRTPFEGLKEYHFQG